MLLRNGYRYLISRLTNTNNYVFYKNTSGENNGTNIRLDIMYASNTITSTSSNIFILQLGSGTTKETFEDYTLENPIQDGLFSNQNVYSKSYNEYAENNLLFICSHIVQNASSEPITVSEIGILNKDCLVTRTVLDEPVVIQPGEFATFTETIEMP